MVVSGRGRRRSGEDRQQQLLVTARRLFSERGYHSTTTRAIAREAGVSDALLYNYFPSKKDLFEALFADFMAEISSLRYAVDFSLPIEDLLRQLGERFIDRAAPHRSLLVILLTDGQSRAMPFHLGHFIDNAAKEFGQRLERGATTGETRPGIDGYLVSRQFIGSIVSHILLSESPHATSASAEMRRYLDQLISTTLHGIAADHPASRTTQGAPADPGTTAVTAPTRVGGGTRKPAARRKVG